MQRRIGLGIALALIATLALTGSTLAFTGLINGSFEDNGNYVDVSGGFEELTAGDASLAPWTVDAGSIDWIGTYWPAQDGAMSIDLSGTSAGTLSQTFATTIGNTYTVSFGLSGNPAGDPAVKTLDVSATGGTPASYSYDATGNDLSNMNWTTETYSFLATSASSTLSFISTTAGAFGPALDNVVVTETVPTKDDCKQGGWQTMIDTAGNAFKNQGDCVSFFATKGKNLGALPPVAAAGAAEAASSAKHADKQQTKVTTKHTTERHAPKAKAKAKSHSSHGHGSKKSK
jgi:choice-of-anchor C domain-containing protein